MGTGGSRDRRLPSCGRRQCGAQVRRRARLQRPQPDPGTGPYLRRMRRPAWRCRDRKPRRGQRPLHRARRAGGPVHLEREGLGQRRDVRRATRDRSAAAPHGRQPRPRRDPLLRADHRALDVARRVRSQLDADAAVQAELGLQRARSRGPRHRRRRRVRRASVLRARLCAVRRRHQLRQHPLVLGAHHRQPRVRHRRLHLQRQLLRTGQLRASSSATACRPVRPARSCPTSRAKRRIPAR